MVRCLVLSIAVSFFVSVNANDALSQIVRYQAGGDSNALIPVPNQYVVGKSVSLNEPLSGSRTPATAGGAIEVLSLGERVSVIELARGASPAGLYQSNAYEFVYPVYKRGGSGLKVYPKPEVIVRLKQGVDVFQFASKYNLSVLRKMLYTDDQFVLRHFSNYSPFDVSDALNQDPDVVWSNPNYAMELKKRFAPNDALYGDQWHLNNTGQFGGTPGADIRAEAAWDLHRPQDNVIIAIVDDAIDTSHPDLNFWSNPAEANGQPGVDDDGNGLIDDISGWDFAENDNTPIPSAEDDNHGTSVAGVAAAIGDNGIGVAGAAYGVPILPVRINLSGDEETMVVFVESAANGLRYAAMHADVMNNSWGGGEVLDAISEAQTFATGPEAKRGEKGVPVLFASGNDASSFVTFEYYGPDFESLEPGPLTVELVYEKDASGSGGEDAVFIQSAQIVEFEFGEWVDWFEAADEFSHEFIEFGGDAPFAFVDHQSYGPVFASGALGNNQRSTLTWETEVPDDGSLYSLQIVFRADTQPESDFFRVFVNGEEVFDFIFSVAGEFDIPFSGSMPLNMAPLAGENLHPGVINIGASTDDDLRSSYSQWGPELHFVAPSNGGLRGITTTDVTGDGNGYDPSSDYTESEDSLFGGTSSASPLAAGAFALALSANPELSVEQLIEIFRETADKIGPLPYDANGFNEQYGYGRINLEGAVQRAIDLREDTNVERWSVY